MLKAGTNELLLTKTISELSEEELNALKENKIEFYGNIVPSLDPIIQVRRSDLLKDCTTKEVGTTSLLTQISADIKLTTSLENAFGKEIAEQISCVGIYENCTQNPFLRKTAGLFMILNSDLNASGLETLRDNKSRDLQEKVFDVLKNETTTNRLHVANDSTVKGKMFLAFIALIMHQALENKMRDNRFLHKFTVSSLLDECKKFSVIRLQDGFECNTEIPLTTRAIF